MQKLPVDVAARWESSLAHVNLRVKKTQFGFCIPNVKAAWISKDPEKREPEIYDWIDSTMDSSSLFIDVGANFGLYSIYATLSVGANVVAFEPHYATYYILHRNIILNKCGHKIFPYALALSNSPSFAGNLKLADISAGKALNALTQQNSKAPYKASIDQEVIGFIQGRIYKSYDQPVLSSSLDYFFANNSSRYSLASYSSVALKVDVDGLDFLVLAGALNSFQYIHDIAVEYLPKDISTHNLIPKLLETQGFKISKQTDNNLIFSRS